MNFGKSATTGALLALALVLGGCGEEARGLTEAEPRPVGATSPPMAASSAPTRTAYPVTITGCLGKAVTFQAAPKRPMTLDQNAWELMMHLGLDDIQLAANVVDVKQLPERFRESAQANLARNEVKPRIPDGATYVQASTVTTNSADAVVTLISTTLTSDAATGGLTERYLSDQGVGSYAGFSSGGCRDEKSERRDLEAVFADIRNLGVIFDVQQRAADLIAQMRGTVTTAAQAREARRATDSPTPRVLNVDYFLARGSVGTYGANSSVNAIIELAGGENLFRDTADLGGAGGYLSTDEASVLTRTPPPDLVLILSDKVDERGTPDCSAQVGVLKKELSGLTAVQAQRFVCVAFHVAAAGGVRAAEVVSALSAAIAELPAP